MFFFFYDEETGQTQEASLERALVSVPDDEYEFFDEKIRHVWHKQEEEWYFSVVDVVGVLTDSKDPRKYWNKLKQRLSEEGSELVTNCHQLKMKAADGKMRFTDAVTMEQMLRLIQSIPSPKAEPIKMWLAMVGAERMDEAVDPQIAIDRAVETYRQQGYSEKWIVQRMRGIEARNELTSEWARAGVKAEKEFALLTDVLYRSWSGMNSREYKQHKGLKKENLRDNMTNTELALAMLAEASTTELSREKNPQGFGESKEITKQGGRIAGNARKELEEALGRTVLSTSNAKDKNLLDK